MIYLWYYLLYSRRRFFIRLLDRVYLGLKRKQMYIQTVKKKHTKPQNNFCKESTTYTTLDPAVLVNIHFFHLDIIKTAI